MKVEKDMAFPYEGMSHTEILIRRVLTTDQQLRDDPIFRRDPPSLVDHTIALLEYLKYYPELELDVVEREMAIMLLEKSKMAKLLMMTDEKEFRETVRHYPGRKHGYCILCGRPYTLKGDYSDGVAARCREKVKRGIWDDWGRPSRAVKRVQFCKKEVVKDRRDPTRLGLRKLSQELGMAESTIRADIRNAKTEIAVDAKYESLKDKAVSILAKYKPTKIPVLVPPKEA